jgi:hypothetical protein
MDTLKRRHTQQTLPDSPPPRYSDSYALGDPCDAFSEKDGKFYKPQKLPENKVSFFFLYRLIRKK